MLFGRIAGGAKVACFVGAEPLNNVGRIGTYDVGFLLLRYCGAMMLFGLIAAGVREACLAGAGLLNKAGCIGTFEVGS